MFKKILIVLFLVIVMTPLGLASEYSRYQALDVNVKISSEMTLVPTSSDYSIDYITVGQSFYPRNTEMQDVLSFETSPHAPIKNNLVTFTWNYPKNNKLSFLIESNVLTKNSFVPVKNKISFPLTNVPNNVEIYTKPSKNIDSDNQAIISLASQIVSGEDDEYIAAYRLANWIENNIKYDLNTLTATASQKASWVLTNKEGVCDEITTLFIAMCRSIGIPARFVSGVAYTNWQNKDDWGPHAWAEVYFPDYGWVPFDITYNQYGFTDPSHIILKQSIDSDETSTDYEWKARNVDLETRPLDISVKEIKKYNLLNPYIKLSVNPVKPDIGFGSYNLIGVNAKNLNNYYFSTQLYLGDVEGMEVLTENRKMILLDPKQEKDFYWIIKLSDNLKKQYTYTIPLDVITTRNFSGVSEFKSDSRDPVYSLEEIRDILKQKQEESQKKYSKNIDLNCELERDYYIYEDVMTKCYIKNTGNVLLKDIKVCAQEKCRIIDLGITQEKELDFLLKFDKTGKKNVIITANSPEVSKSFSLDIDLLDEPNIIIDELEYPTQVEFKDIYNVSFLLKKESYSDPYSVNVKLAQNGLFKGWVIDQLEANQRFILSLEADDLRAGENKFIIETVYYDKNAKEYREDMDFSINLVNVSFGQRIIIFFNGIGRFFQGIFG